GGERGFEAGISRIEGDRHRRGPSTGSRCGARGALAATLYCAAEPFDPAPDFFRPGFQRRAIDDQTRGDFGDVLDFDEAVRCQGRTGLHQIDDVAAQAELWRQLDRAVQFDAFSLNAARGKVAAGDFRVFRRYPKMAPATWIFLPGLFRGGGHRHTAVTDIEIERR